MGTFNTDFELVSISMSWQIEKTAFESRVMKIMRKKTV